MIKIDLKYYKNKNVDLLGDVLKKVEEDKCIKQDGNIISKICNFGNDAVTGEPMIVEYEAESDVKIADMIVEDIIAYYKRGVDKYTNITFKNWFDIWLEKENYKSTRTYCEGMMQKFNNCLSSVIGNEMLQEYECALFNKVNLDCKRRGYHGEYLKDTMNMFKRMINTAIENEFLPETKIVTNKIKSGANKYRFAYLTNDELDLAIPLIMKSEYGLLYLLSLATGMKVSRIIALRKKDINLEKSEIASKKMLTLMISDDGVHIRKIIDVRETRYHPHIDVCKVIYDEFCMCDDNEYCFYNRYSDKSFSAITKDFAKIVKQIGCEKGGLSILRHTAEKIAIEQGMDHVNFKYCFGYLAYEHFLYKYDAINKKGKLKRVQERNYIKLIKQILKKEHKDEILSKTNQ